MITKTQLKAIAAFINKKPGTAGSGLTVDYDRSELFATNGPCAVWITNVSGLDGRGCRIVPLDVVLSAVVLTDSKYVKATETDFCGIMFEPVNADLFAKNFRDIFKHESLALPGRPGLYPSKAIQRIEALDRVFKGESAFILPTSPDKPLKFEIQPDFDEVRPDGDNDWEVPTEIVHAAIMPRLDPPLKNTWDGC